MNHSTAVLNFTKAKDLWKKVEIAIKIPHPSAIKGGLEHDIETILRLKGN